MSTTRWGAISEASRTSSSKGSSETESIVKNGPHAIKISEYEI